MTIRSNSNLTTTTAHRTTTDTSTTNSALRRRPRRVVGLAASLVAAVALGACSTGAGEDAARTTPAPRPERPASTVRPTGGPGSDGITSGSEGTFSSVEPIRVDRIEVVRDEHGDATLAPASDDGDTEGIENVPMMRRRGEAETGTGTGNWTSMYEFLEFVIQANDEYWVEVFAQGGLPEPMVSYVLPEPGVAYQTACGPTDDTSMFYCPTDDQIAFSQTIATQLWDGTYVGPDGQQWTDGEVGDFATALLVSHEYSHSIQQELGWNSTSVTIPMLEQHADCWSGVFSAYAESQGMLDQNDIWEGVVGAWLVGDSHFDSATHHGTSEDRMIAFATGYNGGTPAACDAYLPL